MNLQKTTYINSKKLRDSARGENCTFNVTGVCNYDNTTTVLAHSGDIDDGKGWSKKGSDLFSAFACSSCHSWYDNKANPTEDRAFYFHRGMKRTQTRWYELGLLKVTI